MRSLSRKIISFKSLWVALGLIHTTTFNRGGGGQLYIFYVHPSLKIKSIFLNIRLACETGRFLYKIVPNQYHTIPRNTDNKPQNKGNVVLTSQPRQKNNLENTLPRFGKLKHALKRVLCTVNTVRRQHTDG